MAPFMHNSKFEEGRLFQNFGKLEERSSKFLEIGKFEDFQMNDAYILCILIIIDSMELVFGEKQSFWAKCRYFLGILRVRGR